MLPVLPAHCCTHMQHPVLPPLMTSICSKEWMTAFIHFTGSNLQKGQLPPIHLFSIVGWTMCTPRVALIRSERLCLTCKASLSDLEAIFLVATELLCSFLVMLQPQLLVQSEDHVICLETHLPHFHEVIIFTFPLRLVILTTQWHHSSFLLRFSFHHLSAKCWFEWSIMKPVWG